MNKVAFIGAGRMALAIMKGLIRAGQVSKHDILCISKSGKGAQAAAEMLGVEKVDSAAEAFKKSEIVFLAFKPTSLVELPKDIKDLSKDKIVISVLAATPLEKLYQMMPLAKNIIRLMPNTPCQIGEGTLAYCSLKDKTLSNHAIALIETLGKIYSIEEHKMEAFTVIAGCGPGYFFEFANILEKSAAELGLTDDEAKDIVANMLLGSAKLLEKVPQGAEAHRNQVAPPGGLTAAALDHMNAKGLRDTINSAILEAKKKSDQIINSSHA